MASSAIVIRFPARLRRVDKRTVRDYERHEGLVVDLPSRRKDRPRPDTDPQPPAPAAALVA